ncbi:MAG: 3-deoxy-7-phosphoheptulonate synthase [Polyangiaceae bacterium]|nr:3-deoxy-7-phosphoheptulonate synthase [Polyangiaceae bacterium]
MTIRAAFQGIEGAHSAIALATFFAKLQLDCELVGTPTFREVATAVVSGRAEVGLLPIDNAIAGTVRDGYDLIAQYDLVPLVELDWRMDHRLLGLPGARLPEIREVHAHPLVFAECGRFLATLAGARGIPAEDTGLAARNVAAAGDPTHAAIAPPEAGERFGLVELAANVADHPENITRFLLFAAAGDQPELTRLHHLGTRRKTSLLLSTRHEEGALARCLGILAEAHINLAKLESRPRLGRAWEAVFYLDLEGDVAEPRVAQALEQLRGAAVGLQVLGSYGAADARAPGLPPPPTASAGGGVEPVPPADPAAAGYPKVARAARPRGTRVSLGHGVEIGGDEFLVIAGPCSVESREQMFATARAVVAGGARALRGGAFKPRTNPYAFQGLGWEGVALLAEAGRATGVPIVTEAMSIDQVERLSRESDVLQIGARNMQNFDLLRAVGRQPKPVVLKRGLSASLDELLAAAEYILAEGNPNVILCERGIRTFETATRNTLDLSAVPVLRERSHLPVLVDPSHGVGVRRFIRPLCRAAKAVGAHAIMIEVHPNPKEAKSDAQQALTFDDFAGIMADLASIPYAGGSPG